MMAYLSGSMNLAAKSCDWLIKFEARSWRGRRADGVRSWLDSKVDCLFSLHVIKQAIRLSLYSSSCLSFSLERGKVVSYFLPNNSKLQIYTAKRELEPERKG